MHNAAFRSLLDDVSRCFPERNLDLWASRIELPFAIHTQAETYVMTNHDEVAASFEHYLRAVDVLNVDLIVRNPVSLEQRPDGRWLGAYETRLVSGTQLATDAYVSEMVLSWDGSMFRMVEVLNARGYGDWTRG